MNVLLVDDHPLIRDGMAAMISRLAPHATLLQAADCASGIALARNHDLDLVLLDLGLPDRNGLGALKAFKPECADVPIVVLSGDDDRDLVMSTVEFGAAGFIPKTMNPEQIWSALGVVLNGGIFLPSWAFGAPAPTQGNPGSGGPSGVDPDLPRRLGLTARQSEVMWAIARGLSNKEIAARLDLAEATVKVHASSVMRALKVGSRAQVLLWLTRKGISLDHL
jgi:DNA-binding NarL/FixJ family response regulator